MPEPGLIARAHDVAQPDTSSASTILGCDGKRINPTKAECTTRHVSGREVPTFAADRTPDAVIQYFQAPLTCTGTCGEPQRQLWQPRRVTGGRSACRATLRVGIRCVPRVIRVFARSRRTALAGSGLLRWWRLHRLLGDDTATAVDQWGSALSAIHNRPRWRRHRLITLLLPLLDDSRGECAVRLGDGTSFECAAQGRAGLGADGAEE